MQQSLNLSNQFSRCSLIVFICCLGLLESLYFLQWNGLESQVVTLSTFCVETPFCGDSLLTVLLILFLLRRALK